MAGNLATLRSTPLVVPPLFETGDLSPRPPPLPPGHPAHGKTNRPHPVKFNSRAGNRRRLPTVRLLLPPAVVSHKLHGDSARAATGT